MLRAAALLICLIGTCLSCETHEDLMCDGRTPIYAGAPFPIGVAIDYDALNFDRTYRETADQQFNSISPENIFKASYLHPEKDSFAWSDADSLVKYCLQTKKRLNGASIIWHDQLPDWLLSFQGSSSEWDELMKEHIQMIIRHFHGQVSEWDVVNEGFNADGTLRNTIWRENIGDGYIEKAFRYAREADPDVLLFYNDYDLESNPDKMKAVLTYLNQLRLRGVKIDGIGMQMHMNILTSDPDQVANAFASFAKNNYMIHLSEVDISLNPLNKNISPSKSLFSRPLKSHSGYIE